MRKEIKNLVRIMSVIVFLVFANSAYGQTVVWEKTNPNPTSFSLTAIQLNSERSLPYSSSNSDFKTNAGELYDAYRSNSTGRYAKQGSCLTIKGQYGGNGSGFNIGRVEVGNQYYSVVTNYEMGMGGTSGSESNAVDGDENTWTSYGKATGKKAMSITLCELKPMTSSVPEPTIPIDPCCTPATNNDIMDFMYYKGSGSFNDPYTLKYVPTAIFKQQMKAYITYLHAMNPAINEININWKTRSHGTGSSPGSGSGIIQQAFTTWKWNSPALYPNSNTSNGPNNFFTGFPFQVNTWYSIQLGIYLNNDLTFFNKECADSDLIYFRISQQKSAGNSEDGVNFELIDKRGGRPRVRSIPKDNSPPPRDLPIRRKRS